MFFHYNLYIFILLIYSRVMRMRIRTSFIHTFTQTFTHSCIRACASLTQLFEFFIKMDSPVLSHILKFVLFLVIISLPVISSSIHSDLSSFLVIPPFFTPSFFCAHLSRSFIYTLHFLYLAFYSFTLGVVGVVEGPTMVWATIGRS